MNIHNLLNQIASAEAQLRSTQFFAPCVKGGRVRTRAVGMVYTFTPKPQPGYLSLNPIAVIY